MSLTITEALAEIKTIGKRLESKRASVAQYLARQDMVRDPMEKEGGSQQFIQRERQAIGDLGERIVTLRRGIQRANDETTLTVGETARTISEWLVWRRDVAPGDQKFLTTLRGGINNIRTQAHNQKANVVQSGVPAQPTDVIINISEADLAREIEDMEDVLGTLDGRLSLVNATTQIKE